MSDERLLPAEMVGERDWRKAFRGPSSYRIINRTLLKSHTLFLLLLVGVVVVLMFLWHLYPREGGVGGGFSVVTQSGVYNNTYPLSRPIRTGSLYTFRIGIITDLDTNSKSTTEPHTWYSYFKKGYLSYNPADRDIKVTWDGGEPKQLFSHFALKDRGMELSELLVFNGRLLAFDDRTGLVYEIENERAVPWVLLTDGDGKLSKGFKSEWATVKDHTLYVGSMGKEWTTEEGLFQNYNPMFIKAVTTKGEVTHLNWVEQYKRIRDILNIKWPGYMIHESAVWSDVHKRWFFLPRRCSSEVYSEKKDEHMGCSVLISTDANVFDVQMVRIVNAEATRGFSTFKFVPTTDDTVIVALRTEEIDGKTATYVTAFTIKGDVLLPDTFVSDLKYEGLEFI